MSPLFLALLALVALFIWTVGAYGFWRINRTQQAKKTVKDVSPALRLAEQWLSESQAKMERFVQGAEQPLGAAQNELLELRLEAGRLSQGIKDLRLVRESLATALRPVNTQKGFADLLSFYLEEGNFEGEGPALYYFVTPLGKMPCLEVAGTGPLTEASMKTALAGLNYALSQNPALGGFLYFPLKEQYLSCLGNAQWMEGLKASRVMVLDLEGLTALLLSLRLAKDTEKVVQTFQEGVDSTKTLIGQSDRMNAALSRLSGHSLKARTVIEGGHPSPLEPKE